MTQKTCAEALADFDTTYARERAEDDHQHQLSRDFLKDCIDEGLVDDVAPSGDPLRAPLIITCAICDAPIVNASLHRLACAKGCF